MLIALTVNSPRSGATVRFSVFLDNKWLLLELRDKAHLLPSYTTYTSLLRSSLDVALLLDIVSERKTG